MRLNRTTAALGLMALCLGAACAKKEVILPGERFNVRTPLEASLPQEGKPLQGDGGAALANQSVPISLPGQTAAADWTHRAGNAAHSPINGALSPQPQRIWSVGIGQGDGRRNRISAAPVVAGGRVFTLDASAGVQATSTAGAVLWAADLTPPTDRRDDVSGGGLAYGDGRLFVATGYGELISVDPASGAVQWRQKLGSPVTGAPSVDGGIVYVVGRDSSAWAVDTDTGRVRWTVPGTPSAAGYIGSAGPAIGQNAVFLPFASGELVAVLKRGGTRIWSSAVAGARLGRSYTGIGDITGDPVISGATIYAGNSDGKTVAISLSSGERVWTADDGALGPVLPVGGSVFLVNDEAKLVRLDAATGQPIWSVGMPYYEVNKRRKRKSIYPHFGPVLAGGRLIVASGDGVLRLFNPVDGASLGTVELPGGAATLPALAGGVLYVVSSNGQLHAFR